jgi:hypothetical protein
VDEKATGLAQSVHKAPDDVAKISSKKRAKARKDRQGLQALLNKSAQIKSGPGLGLLDFMRQP